MFKKTLFSLSCALALGAVAAPAFAASSFFLVVPLPARSQVQEPVEAITVSLAGAALPKATVNQAYSESLRPYLSVTGDAAFDPATANWSLAEGTLPAGLALDATTGAVAGTPTAKTTSPASFTVLATYKGKDGQAVYTIDVGGQVLHVSKIAAGVSHTCAVTTSGGAVCWGANYNGQLGDNSTTNRLMPVHVAGLSSGVVGISAGGAHSCVITISGAAKCWGGNFQGQLGNNTKTDHLTPVDVVGLSSGVSSISASSAHTCVVVGGAAKCWGYNITGQLGDNSTTSRLTPVDVVGLSSGVSSISGGNSSTCAVLNSGAVKCWGSGVTGIDLTPVDVVGLSSGVASISLGYYHTCAVMTSGAAKCWGANWTGQLGDDTGIDTPVPTNVVGLTSGVVSISAGESHTCASMVSGAVSCWGGNDYGQLGVNSWTTQYSPVSVPGLSGVAHVSVGDYHSCAMMTDGAVKCWGSNPVGQLGDNSTSDRHTPVDVQGFQ